MKFSVRLIFAAWALGLALAPVVSRAASPGPENGMARETGLRVRFGDSVRAIPVDAPFTRPHRVREKLRNEELAESRDFVVSLRMRNFDQFQSLIQSGRTIAKAEMETDYLPSKSDYDRLVVWLADQGFAFPLVDQNHTNIFVRGNVAKIAAALEVSFARVATADGEFTSAVSAPSLPAALATPVLGIDGLQPHILMRAVSHPLAEVAAAVAHPIRAIPADLLATYHVPDNLTGAGQTIAVFMDTLPLASDLAAFYQAVGVNGPPGFSVVSVNGGPTIADSAAAHFNEATLDTEWSTGVAPGAKLIVYSTPTGSVANFVAACTQILNDGVAKIVTSSISSPETQFPLATLQSSSQLFAQMAAAGITILHGSGDSGSYRTGVAPEYPTSDPYVTALSGTAITFDANWIATGETVWANTGGGLSGVFPRPLWQTGPGVPAGTMRCIPDAAAPSSMISSAGALFPFVVLNGKTNTGIGGTSLTGPVWAGLVAIINEARAKVGLPTVGLLGPKIYPLIGTSAFTDITVGSNGGYNAGAGYDLCSGVGSPNMAALIEALTSPPAISVQSGSQTIASGASVVFRVSAISASAPTYQWSLNGHALPGATQSLLVVSGATAADAGIYTCVVTNSASSVTSTPATLALSSTPDIGRLINLSILTDISAAVPNFTVGMVIGGAGTTGDKPLLVRAAGPSLAPLGVSGALPDPKADFFAGPTMVGTNDNWGGAATLTSAFTQVGAFAFADASSKDAAIYNPALTAGSYTMQVSAVAGVTGTVIAEIYDATPPGALTAATPRLMNVSVLKQIVGGSPLTAGFVIGGSTAKTVLIRAIGPALGLAPFNISGAMMDPHLTLFDGNAVAVAVNDDWGGDAPIAAASTRVGAFAITNATSKDAMMLTTLRPGSYTVQVGGANNGSGLVIVEIYDVP